LQLDPTDEETPALLNLLAETIEIDRYPFSSRVRTLRGILNKSAKWVRRHHRRRDWRHLKNAIPPGAAAEGGGESECADSVSHFPGIF
jgi:hypothetical protein